MLEVKAGIPNDPGFLTIRFATDVAFLPVWRLTMYARLAIAYGIVRACTCKQVCSYRTCKRPAQEAKYTGAFFETR